MSLGFRLLSSEGARAGAGGLRVLENSSFDVKPSNPKG